MSGEAAWFSERRPDDEPRVRWLGFFPRPLHLVPSLPRRVVVGAPPPPAEAQRLLISAPGPLPTATALQVDTRPKLIGPRGSLPLTDLILSDEPQASREGSGDGPSDPRLRVRDRPWIPLWKRLAYLLQIPAALLVGEVSAIEWPGQLFPYQLEGVRALLSQDALLLADDMGLGKTIQAIAALRLLMLQRQAESSLILTPAGLVGQWRLALRRWAPELRVSTIRGPAVERAWQWTTPAHVYLASYDTFREDASDNPQSPPRRRLWDMVILD